VISCRVVPKQSSHIQKLARIGAAYRLKELKAEIASLLKVFPHLRYGSAVSPSMPDNVEERRPRRKLSAAARKKISDAQKKRWAAARSGKS
jgi:hypothetical protein